MKFGGGFEAVQSLVGLVDEFAVFNRVRAAEEIARDHMLAVDSGEPVILWRFNEIAPAPELCPGQVSKFCLGRWPIRLGV